MANPEHLQILQQGVEAWNTWRERNRDIRPDLTDGSLLRGGLPMDLSEADLRYANFRWTDLRGANFRSANLRSAKFHGANLYGTDLRDASLRYANLTRADLRDANLRLTDFRDANLTDANLSHVVLVATVFGNTNLTAVQGLETCIHIGPSTLDHRTLAQSGPLPLAFLRGCGLPERLIEYLPSILGEAIQFYSCFISYSCVDEDFCRRLHGRMQDAGLRVWFAPHDIQGGRKLHEQIDDAIRV
jgi:hypothetical protein